MAEGPGANPPTAGLPREHAPQPSTLVILGAAGDLAGRKLLPALYNLAVDGLLPAGCAVLGVARRAMDDAAFQASAQESVARYSRRPPDAARWPAFARTLRYQCGSLDDAAAYAELRRRLEKIEGEGGAPGVRIFYLSVPPSLVTTCVERLQAAGLVTGPGDRPASRVVVEKPVGRDPASARAINEALARAFDERQIFRIDHYLGKETVQDIMVLRFANAVFEPIWNQKYVDHVQITVAEAERVGTRAGYDEEAGALRDMVQNHILQVLSLIAMEPPWSLDADVVRGAKLEAIRCLRPLRGADVARSVVRAQYGPGRLLGGEVPGYRGEAGVRGDSRTETYVALRCFIDNWRWAGVPFYLRTGKRLPVRCSEVAIAFKAVPQILFNADPAAPLGPDVLAVRIQPDEGVSFWINAKLPGAQLRVTPVKMDFRYGASFAGPTPEAYERLLLDVMAGDATLFIRRDAVEVSWAWTDGILEAWARAPAAAPAEYAAGSWGPAEAERLIAADGRAWRTL